MLGEELIKQTIFSEESIGQTDSVYLTIKSIWFILENDLNAQCMFELHLLIV